MKFLLDTNIVIEIVNSPEDGRQFLTKRFQSVPEGDICISAVSVMELKKGLQRLKKTSIPEAKKTSIRTRTELMLSLLPIFPFDEAAAEEAAKLKCHSLEFGRQLSDLDVCIAGHAVSLRMILVSSDRKAFEKLNYPELQWTDWEGFSEMV